jgi:mycothiol synthase
MRDLRLSLAPAPDGADARAIMELVARASEAAGHESLSEHKRIEVANASIRAGSDSGDGLILGILARQAGTPALIGYGHLNRHAGTYAMEIVVDPAEGEDGEVADSLFAALIAQVAELGGGQVRLWVTKATESDDTRALARGLARERNLIQMRCPLPLPPRDGGSGPTVTIETRPFVVGSDEEAWLTTNNRAFASHPEQGHWQRQTLVELESEPWFDAEGFLVLERDGRMAGSCWTKVHATTSPPMGEIYVIGVDPDYHGKGWGRALTEAGLEWLAAQGLRVGMLYVDEENQQAATLYRSMGFVTDHVDRSYLGMIAPG